MPNTKKNNAKASPSPKIEELQRKIRDASYVYGAIESIASVVSRRIVEGHAVSGKGADFLIH